jgi:hypothetical protein
LNGLAPDFVALEPVAEAMLAALPSSVQPTWDY